MTEENEATTIRLSKKTRERLREVGTRGQSDDDVLNLLIDVYWEGKK